MWLSIPCHVMCTRPAMWQGTSADPSGRGWNESAPSESEWLLRSPRWPRGALGPGDTQALLHRELALRDPLTALSLGHFTYSLPGPDQSGAGGFTGTALGGVRTRWWYLGLGSHLPACPCAPLACADGPLMAPGMGMGAGWQGVLWAPPPAIAALRSCRWALSDKLPNPYRG